MRGAPATTHENTTFMSRTNNNWHSTAGGSSAEKVPQTATPALFPGARRASHGPKFFFATKMTSDSIGAKEDPRQARRVKLSKVVQDSQKKDRTAAGMLMNTDRELANQIYGTQVNT